MKVLILLSGLFDTIGGIESYNRSLINAIEQIADKHSWEVTVYALNDKSANTNHNLHYKGFNRNKFMFASCSILASKSSDIVIFGHVNFSPLAMFMDKRNYKYLITHGIDVWKKLPPLQALGTSQINTLLPVSKFTATEMDKHNPQLVKEYKILPNSLSPGFIENGTNLQSREQLSLSPGKMILTVSRLSIVEKYKGIDLMIKSIKKITEQIPDTFLVIVGDGEDKPRLKNIAKDEGVANKVIFTGKISSKLLPSFYNACDLFVLPSTKEGFGIVFLEAMYFSKTCVGVSTGGVPEVIEDGRTGLLCKQNDIDSLTNTVIHLLTNEALRHSLGKAGKEKVEKEFLFHRFKENLETILCSNN